MTTFHTPPEVNKIAEGQSRSTAGLGAHFEAPKNVWWCNFGTYGHLTLREEEADSARANGAQVFVYIQSPIEEPEPDRESEQQEREMVTVTREMAMDAGCPDMEGDRIQW